MAENQGRVHLAGEATRKILAALLQSPREGQELLFERYRDPLLKRARRLVQSQGLWDLEPADLLQSMWLRVACKEDLLQRFEYRGKDSLLAWLMKGLENTARDEARRRSALKRNPSASTLSLDETRRGETLLEMNPAPDQSPTSKARVEEMLGIARSALREREWTVWHGVVSEGCTCVELADRLDASDSAIRSLLHRAHLKVLQALGDGTGEL